MSTIRKCDCGCGESWEVSSKGGMRRYFSADCYPSSKKNRNKGKTKPLLWLKVCKCPCNRIFTDGTRRQNKMFHTPTKCRRAYVDDDNRASHHSAGSGFGDEIISKPYQQTVCCGRGLKRQGRFRGCCAVFMDCSAREKAGGKFTFETDENGGRDCYVGPCC